MMTLASGRSMEVSPTLEMKSVFHSLVDFVQALLQPALRFLDAKMLVERLQILRGLWLWAASCRIELVQALLQRAHCSLAGKVHVEGLRPLPGLRLCSSTVG